MTRDLASCLDRAMGHVRVLAGDIGGRGSCTAAEQRAAEYAAQEMKTLGARAVAVEPFRAAPGTYRPYAVAFGLALLSTGAVWLWPGRATLGLAALAHAAAAWGMLVESDLRPSWIRHLLPRATGHNAVGVLPAAGEVRRRVVLCAHLDTHRTPVFYSSEAWQRLFTLIVTVAFASLAAGMAAYGIAALLDWAGVRWLGMITGATQLIALALSIHAELTPHSPGANDNASGVGVTLALAERLASAPLEHTEIWLALTDCEEVMSQGMVAFVDAHGTELGQDAVYVILDQVGAGHITWLTVDGLIRKHKTHPLALDLARRAAAALPDVKTGERPGVAYTDAVVATQRDRVALTLSAIPGEEGAGAHWHQMSDTVDVVQRSSLADTYLFVGQVLSAVEGLGSSKGAAHHRSGRSGETG